MRRSLLATPLLRHLSVGPRRRALGFLLGLGGAVVFTAVVLPFRDDITPLSKGFGFLIVVVIAAATGGLVPGIVASIVSFLAFNFFFIPPYHTFVIGRAEDLAILIVFLGLSVLISTLLARAQERAAAAEARRGELELLQRLSAELVSLSAGHERYEPTVNSLLAEFGFTKATLFVEEGQGIRERITVGTATDWRPKEQFSLAVGGRKVGSLALYGERPLLNAAERRVISALCDQVAMAFERDRLLAVETDAEALRKTDSLRKALLAAVSHELRSPLAAIKASATDLISDDAVHNPESVRGALESINSETDRLNAVIANLLDMSRIEGGLLKPRLQVVDLIDILQGPAERIRRLRPDVEIQLPISTSSLVTADPLFLDRIVSNLLENGARAAEEATSKRVDVSMGNKDGRVIVSVRDHGRGVPPEAKDHLFYPFYRLDERQQFGGSGLGLAITKGFLTLMNGDIWLEDTIGGGATFSFSLPAVPARRESEVV